VPAALTSSWLIQRRSKTGRSERIGGSQAKLCSGGGDDVAHSSELACHGSAPAVGGRRKERTTLIRNGTIDSMSTPAPIVEIMFHSSKSSVGS
jgi:hypothetical protein